MKKQFLLFFALVCAIVVPANAQTSSWTAPLPKASALTSGEGYYVYNVKGDGFLINGNDWKTQASLKSDEGIKWTIEQNSDGTAWTLYQASAWDSSDREAHGYLYWSGGEYWVDDATGTGEEFAIASISGSSSYTIQGSVATTADEEGDEGLYLGYAGNWGDGSSRGSKEALMIVEAISSATDSGTEWVLVAPDDYTAWIADTNRVALKALYSALTVAESLGMTADTNETYKKAGEVYTSSTSTAEEITVAARNLRKANALATNPAVAEGGTVTVDGAVYNIVGQNEIYNPSFEFGYTGWTSANDFLSEINSGYFDLKTDGAQDGNTYLFGKTNTGASGAGSLGTVWPVEKEKTYVFSYYVKDLASGTGTDSQYLKVSFTNTAGDENGGKIISTTPTVGTDWTLVQVAYENSDYELCEVDFRWLNSKWNFDNFQLYEVEINELGTAIERAKTVVENTENVGTAVFQKSPAEVTAAIEAAQELDENATSEEIEATIAAIEEAVEAFENAELNKPKEGETVSIILTESSSKWNELAVEPDDTKNASAGGFGFYFVSAWNRNYAPQNFTFIPDDSKTNGYIISFQTQSGGTEYLCLGSVYSGNTSQIRATTSKNNAFVFEVQSKGEGIWHIYNSGSSHPVGNGSNDGGFFSGENHADLRLVSNEIPVNITAAGWTTLVLPYDAELPSTDLTAYTIAGQSTSQDNAVTLTEVTDGKLTAKQPYLINGTEVKEYAINGTSTVFNLSTAPSDSYLVGTWEYIESVPQNNYVLQYQPDVNGTAFYIVNSNDITLAMNRCYLTGTNLTSLSAPYFSLSMNDNTATAIEAVAEETAETGDGAIYDLGGRRVSKARKGIYIKDGKKVIIK